MIISLFSSGGGGTYDVKLGVALPTVDDTGLVYDGTAKSPTIGSYSTDLMTVTVTSQTNAGTYQVHCSLKDKTKYAWLNTIDSADQDIPWTIERAVGTLTLSANSIEVGEDGTETVTVTTSESTTIHAVSNDTDVATVSVSGITLSVSDGGSEGTATITISADDSTNYTYGSVTLAVETVYLQIVTWANGTDAQIAKMCAASDEGKLNLYDYWNVGDKRTVSLSAIPVTFDEVHRAQNVVFVIVNKCGYATTDGKISAFIVQQENLLSSTDSGTTSDSELGQMDTYSTDGGWGSSQRRSWCNSVYRNAIPNTLRSIFKEVKVKEYIQKNASGSTIVDYHDSIDYFFFPAETEVFDTKYNSYVEEYNVLSMWTYYNTSSNRNKKIGSSGSSYKWWTRSVATSSGYVSINVMYGGNTYADGITTRLGIAPCGCIGTVNDGNGYTPPTWSDGSDEEIVNVIAKADAGEIDLTDYWNIGDKRTISLSAMPATYVSESHVAQDVVMTIVAKDNKTSDRTNPCWNYQYVTATSGRTYPSFIVQQDNLLSNNSVVTKGYMHNTNTNSGSWSGCKRRTWCNSIYYQSIPSSLRSIFKQVKVKTANVYNGSEIQTANDYFFLPAEKETCISIPSDYSGIVYGDGYYGLSNTTERTVLSNWPYYYNTKVMRAKGALGRDRSTFSSAEQWLLRSPYYNNSKAYLYVNYDGGVTSYANASLVFSGIAPCGCI